VELGHVFVVLKKEVPVVIRYTSDFVPALIGVEHEFMFFGFDISGVLGQHKLIRQVFVLEQFVLHAEHLLVVLEAEPLSSVFFLEKRFFFVNESSICTEICLVYLFTHAKQIFEGIRLIKVVLQVLSK